MSPPPPAVALHCRACVQYQGLSLPRGLEAGLPDGPGPEEPSGEEADGPDHVHEVQVLRPQADLHTHVQAIHNQVKLLSL